MKEEAKGFLEKADHALIVAADLLKLGHKTDAASKIYYSMFYAAQALLKDSDIEVIKHSAVEAAFGYYFSKPGKIDPKYHKALIEARKIRESADYDFGDETVEPRKTLSIEEGKEFIDTIKKFLTDKNSSI